MKRDASTPSEPRGRRTRRTRRLRAAAILAAVLLAGAGATALYVTLRPDRAEVDPSPPEGRTPSTPAVPVTVGARPGEQAPDFDLTTTTGETFRLSSYRGQVVLLDFLAPG